MRASLAKLQVQRRQVLQQISAIDRLRRGSLSRQFFHSPSRARQGPYYVLQGYVQGRKFSQRVPASQVRQLRPWVANYQRFVRLAERLVTLTDRLTRLAQGQAPPVKHRPNSAPPP